MSVGDRSRSFSWEDPSPFREAAMKMNGLEFLHAIGSGELPTPPIMRAMGIEPVDVDEGRVIFSAKPEEYHLNPLGVAHAGLAVTLMDTAMGCAIHSRLPAGVGYLTLELKVNFVRPLVPGMGSVTCEGSVLHLGSRVGSAEARVLDKEGRLCAHATSTCLVMDAHSQRSGATGSGSTCE